MLSLSALAAVPRAADFIPPSALLLIQMSVTKRSGTKKKRADKSRSLSRYDVITLQGYNDLFLHQQLHNNFRRIGYRCSGAEDGGDAGFVQEVIVLCGDDTTGGDHDVGSAEFLEFLDDLRDEGLMTSCQRGDTQHMDIVLDGLFSSELACNVSRNFVSRVSCRSSSSQINNFASS